MYDTQRFHCLITIYATGWEALADILVASLSTGLFLSL